MMEGNVVCEDIRFVEAGFTVFTLVRARCCKFVLMKIALAQQNYHIGNFEKNVEKIIDGIARAKKQGADLVVFSELCVCGYPPRDFVEFNDFINKCYQAIETIKEHADTIGVLIGSPSRNSRLEGKDLFNS